MADVAIFLVLGSTCLKSAAKLVLFFDMCKDFYKNSAKKLILLQIGILLYRISFFGAEGEEIGAEGGFAVGEVTLGKEGRLVLGGQDGILLAAVDHL